MARPFSIPAYYAAAILRAWQDCDREGLRANLEVAGTLGPPPDLAEEERAEVLAAVAAEMREMGISGSTEGEAACLNLLRHLARAGPRAHAVH